MVTFVATEREGKIWFATAFPIRLPVVRGATKSFTILMPLDDIEVARNLRKSAASPAPSSA